MDGRRSSRRDEKLGDSGKRERTVRRRKGFAYAYKPEEGDENNYPKEENERSDKSMLDDVGVGVVSADGNVIDVEATVQNESLRSKSINDRNRKGRQTAKQSWEERAQAFEQVPPSKVKAWGPEGMIDGGIDIRTYAARNALEEIRVAREVFQTKEELVNVAENNLIQLKR